MRRDDAVRESRAARLETFRDALPRMRPGRSFLSPFAALGLRSGCHTPTEITFDITTNVSCAEIEDTSFTSGPLTALTDGRPAATVTHGCASSGRGRARGRRRRGPIGALPVPLR
jgi:hypothetical protein